MVGDSFDKVKFAIRLVPSMDNEDFIMQLMNTVGGPNSQYTGLESGAEYDEVAITDPENDNPLFNEWSGSSRQTYPVLRVDEESVPSGNSIKMCLGVSWNINKRAKQWDKYLDVRGFDECLGLKNGRAHWEKIYPSRGLNFLLWD